MVDSSYCIQFIDTYYQRENVTVMFFSEMSSFPGIKSILNHFLLTFCGYNSFYYLLVYAYKMCKYVIKMLSYIILTYLILYYIIPYYFGIRKLFG